MQPGKEGLKPESRREGELSVAEESAHRQPTALEEPQAEGQCGERMARGTRS